MPLPRAKDVFRGTISIEVIRINPTITILRSYEWLFVRRYESIVSPRGLTGQHELAGIGIEIQSQVLVWEESIGPL